MRLCLAQDSSSSKKLPLLARLSHLCLYFLVVRSTISLVWRSFFLVLGLRSRACEKASDEGDLEGSEVDLVAKSGAPISSSVGSSQ